MFPKPLPGLYLISVDRMGHGSSSPLLGKEEWSHSCEEMLELMDDLKVEKFCVMGWSLGGVHALQMAVAFPDRVTGAELIAESGRGNGRAQLLANSGRAV